MSQNSSSGPTGKVDPTSCNEGPRRDHLFLSYAWEDGALAEWLARKLAASGYSVWIDRFKLLGGEPWPVDIDRAIKERAFRMIALLSRHSVQKPNPMKERQLAIAISKARGIADFLIPLNIDGLEPTELGWELSDLTYIPFQRWSSGLSNLFAKLEAIQAPRTLGDGGLSAAAATFDPPNVLVKEQESLYTNCIRVVTIPAVIRRYSFSRGLAEVERSELQRHWAYEANGDIQAFAFTDPPTDILAGVKISRGSGASWRDLNKIDGVRSTHIVSALIKKSLLVASLAKGLVQVDGTAGVFFPPGLLPKDVLPFRNYTGRKTRVSVVGERKLGAARVRYQLGLGFWVRTDLMDEYVVQTKIRLHITDPSGTSLTPAACNARRKKIAKSWWNHDWLSRQMAMVQFLASDDTRGIRIGSPVTDQLCLSADLLTTTVTSRINEVALEPLRKKVQVMAATGGVDPDTDEIEREEVQVSRSPVGELS